MASIKLSWTPNPVSELVSEYHVFQGLNGGGLGLVAVVTTPEITFVDLPFGNYRWAVKAANVAGISEFSVEVSGPAVPSAPTGLTVEVL